MEDIDYPRRKEEILDYAKSHNLPEDIMTDLQDISDRVCDSSSEISSRREDDQAQSGNLWRMMIHRGRKNEE